MLLQSIIGISVVFLALIALSFCIYLFGKLMNTGKKKQEIQTEQVEEENMVIEVEGDDQLIAVITAAVNAYFSSNGLTPDCKIKVKAFNRIASNAPIWNEVSKKELVQNL
ncbi:MAG: OadG family protein [Clostridia bacterium]|nr:OadG family protein [Clostridia bacterium]